MWQGKPGGLRRLRNGALGVPSIVPHAFERFVARAVREQRRGLPARSGRRAGWSRPVRGHLCRGDTGRVRDDQRRGFGTATLDLIAEPFRGCRVRQRGVVAAGAQLTAFFTSAAIFASSAAVNPFNAKATGHIAPLSRFAVSLKPNIAYLSLNL
jgi:hypothetical protein